MGEPTEVQRRGWEAIRSGADTLIAAPTGSGKTLAAFLGAIDGLFRDGLAGKLQDQVKVIYVSPLKALSADIHKNLAIPRREIHGLAEAAGLAGQKITAAVRSGDTTPADRLAMLKTPPHILVTTPESLYLLLTAERSRQMLATAELVIIDEIHAVLETRRGAHLSLTLERLDHVAGRRLQRIGLSATQRPIEVVADWLTGGHRPATIVDAGHRREIDLALELPGSPLQAVMSAEVWAEVYDRLTTLIREHQTTLIFVNTRRLAERVARQLADRLGETAVTAHHGSLSKEMRLDAEHRLKEGQLKALVATASLELGIDIGHVDLVCQIASPRRIATLLQRVGRAGHTVRGTPKGRLFPLTRDELVEAVALLTAVNRGELDRVVIREEPLDVLAQQVVAESAAETWDAETLYQLFRRARPYHGLSRERFDEVVRMLASGYVTRRGRRGALIHYDQIHQRIKGRRGARLTSLTAGGAIPDNADYRVIQEPDGTFVGTLNEDFAIESMAGDIFQLGNTSWRLLRVERGTVRVEDARGEPPTVPFWLGEAPARSDELSAEVAALRQEIGDRASEPGAARQWLEARGIDSSSITQLLEYLGEARRMLGAIPTQELVIAERFFDEAGGMQLVIHAPFGSRVNRAWGLALRKRFCRQFNFELQAAATDNAVLLSLGPQHSFPLESVFRFLSSESAVTILIQAFLDAPVFATRWRWNANISLAVPRYRSGRKVPPPIQRMEADDLLAAAFPDAAACLENIPGDREIPDHPLVKQVIDDCLHEAMDAEGLLRVLRGLERGEIKFLGRDLPEPSPLAHEILNAAPYAFLDDAPLEERRALAVQTRRAFEPSNANDLGALDPQAIIRVREEVWPDPRDADELHDALVVSGFLTAEEVVRGDGGSWASLMAELESSGRAARLEGIWVATERAAEGRSLPDETAVRELLRGRMEIIGPVTADRMAFDLNVPQSAIDAALFALEAEGVVLRGRFTEGVAELEWCDRRLLARIHRYTLNRLRAEIEPVSGSDFMKFLLGWQRVGTEDRAAGLEGLDAVIKQLSGYEVAAGAWEADVLGIRCQDYDPTLLDTLCLTGRAGWARLSITQPQSSRGRPIRTTPIAIFDRDGADRLFSLAPRPEATDLSSNGRAVFETLGRHGASFIRDLVNRSGLLITQVEEALAELATLGLVTSDSYAGLRALITPSGKRAPITGGRHRHRAAATTFDRAGRWSLLSTAIAEAQPEARDPKAIESYARILLGRYGMVFHRILNREPLSVPWRELLMVYRRLEARGEIRGGRFVAGVTGEQFALPEAVVALRAARRAQPTGRIVAVSAVDPLNLVGIVTPGERIAAVAGTRIAFEDGKPIAVIEGGMIRPLVDYGEDQARAVAAALTRRAISPKLRALLGLGRTAGDRPLEWRRRKRESAAPPTS